MPRVLNYRHVAELAQLLLTGRAVETDVVGYNQVEWLGRIRIGHCSQQSNATAWAGLPRQPEPRRAARNVGLRFDRAIRSRLKFGGLHLLWWLKLFGLLGLRLIIDRHREQPPP